MDYLEGPSPWSADGFLKSAGESRAIFYKSLIGLFSVPQMTLTIILLNFTSVFLIIMILMNISI